MSIKTDQPRGAWVKYGLLATLMFAGLAGGLYLSGGWPGFSNASEREPTDADKSPRSSRFPLTAADISDTNEAPSLSAGSDGRVYLAWASRTGASERTLFLTATGRDGKLFGEPETITRSEVFKSVSRMKGKEITRELKMVPHVAVDGDKVHLAWTEALPENAGVRQVLATSADTGVTFGAPSCVHRGKGARTTFTALAIGPDGAVACSWLDNRERSQWPMAAVRSPDSTEFAEELVVHTGQDGKGVCPCCPTSACFGPDGTLYVAFRNVQDGFRDIAVGRLRPGTSSFEGPYPVVGNTWKFDGCPHDGASLAVVGDALHITWMDARTGRQRCYHARTKLAGDLKFEGHEELNAAAEGTQGNAKLYADAAGVLHAVWEESTGPEPAVATPARHSHGTPSAGKGGGRAIFYGRFSTGKSSFVEVRAVAPKPGAFQTRPALVAASGRLFVAWNELDESGKAVVVTSLKETPGEAQP